MEVVQRRGRKEGRKEGRKGEICIFMKFSLLSLPLSTSLFPLVILNIVPLTCGLRQAGLTASESFKSINDRWRAAIAGLGKRCGGLERSGRRPLRHSLSETAVGRPRSPLQHRNQHNQINEDEEEEEEEEEGAALHCCPSNRSLFSLQSASTYDGTTEGRSAMG